jgi:plastocyanin
MAFKRALIATMVVGVVLLLGACGSDDDGPESVGSGSIEITASGTAFTETEFEVDAGSEVEVTLTNEDETEHSFTIEDPEFEIEAHGGEDANGTFTAPEEGSVEFFCKYHPGVMTGTISVGGAAAGDSGSGDSGGNNPYSGD